MDTPDVRIVELPPMRVASVHGKGTSPELEAWRVLREWAEPRGLLDAGTGARVFGFNNPSPVAGSAEYGYDFWITIGEETVPSEPVRLHAIDGGLYAVLRCQTGGNPSETIPRAWQTLVDWQQRSEYAFGPHQWLEELVELGSIESGDFAIELYLPIARKQKK
jgi:DNA gyrase inhibitor GyrI